VREERIVERRLMTRLPRAPSGDLQRISLAAPPHPAYVGGDAERTVTDTDTDTDARPRTRER
jgi:hypothetical protein